MAAAPWGLGIILIRPTGKVQSLLKVRPKIKSFDTLCEVPLLRRGLSCMYHLVGGRRRQRGWWASRGGNKHKESLPEGSKLIWACSRVSGSLSRVGLGNKGTADRGSKEVKPCD